ncbi:MAG: CapA family protein [Bilifractor sp.]
MDEGNRKNSGDHIREEWPLLKTRPDGSVKSQPEKVYVNREEKHVYRTGAADRADRQAGRQRVHGSGRREAAQQKAVIYDTSQKNKPEERGPVGGRHCRKRPHRMKKIRRWLRRNRRLCYFILILLLVVLGVVIIGRAVSVYNKKVNEEQAVAAEKAAAKAAAEKEAAEKAAAELITPTDLLMSFTGDFILGTDENFLYDTSMNAYYDANGAKYFLDGVRPVFQQDDLTVINFEGTLTDETDRVPNQFAFKAPPEYVDIINDKYHASIEAANVANNHSHDYGEKSFTDTLTTLSDNNILTFGYDDVAVKEVKGVKVGLFGIYELDEYGGVAPQVTQDIQKLKDQDCDIIIAVFHWGNELQSCPDEYQHTLAHQAIDEGADLVVGHHPHVIQGIEYYKGKTIMYSLGNFLFGGNSNPTEIDTVIFQMKFSVDDHAKITGNAINIIPCLEGTNWQYNDYQPTILTGNEGQLVIDKLDERSQEIANTYDDVESVYNSETDGTIGFQNGNEALDAEAVSTSTTT